MRPEDLQRLQDYVDGELDAGLLEEIERLIAEDPQWAQALDRLRAEQATGTASDGPDVE